MITAARGGGAGEQGARQLGLGWAIAPQRLAARLLDQLAAAVRATAAEVLPPGQGAW
ncbi:hypothetical protein ACO2Q3_11580 [Caulobacter sp. KR2-114]|uniref:hypothetical protein n=1 Tax=Caulobacter sp. KR2-114 TaxID=3400912 RepID=UPI003BFC4FEA